MAPLKSLHLDKDTAEKVKDPTPVPTECRYCNGPVELVENSEIYRRNYGKWPYAYLCRPCNAYVGLHPNTLIPLGSLADGELRRARKTSKELFYAYVKDFALTRSQGYAHLAAAMGIHGKHRHFGMFEQDQCELAVQKIQELYTERKKEQEDQQ